MLLDEIEVIVGAVVSITIAWFVPREPAAASAGSVRVAVVPPRSLIVPLANESEVVAA